MMSISWTLLDSLMLKTAPDYKSWDSGLDYHFTQQFHY